MFPLSKEGKLIGYAGFAADKDPVLKLPPDLAPNATQSAPNVVKFPKAG